MTVNWSNVMELNEQNVKLVSDQPGIYRLSHQDGEDRLFHYVGQAINLKNRIMQHLPSAEKNSCCNNILRTADCYFRYAVIENQSDRDAAEAALYLHCGKPKCCDRIPDCEPCDINFE